MLAPDEEQVLRSLLQQAFTIISGINLEDDNGMPMEVREMFRTWVLETHAMMCPNHEEIQEVLLRKYNAASN
jgi:hypothetical protein